MNCLYALGGLVSLLYSQFTGVRTGGPQSMAHPLFIDPHFVPPPPSSPPFSLFHHVEHFIYGVTSINIIWEACPTLLHSDKTPGVFLMAAVPLLYFRKPLLPPPPSLFPQMLKLTFMGFQLKKNVLRRTSTPLPF